MSYEYESVMMIDGCKYYHVLGYYLSRLYSGLDMESVSKKMAETMSPMICRRLSTAKPILQDKMEHWNIAERGLCYATWSAGQVLKEYEYGLFAIGDRR